MNEFDTLTRAFLLQRAGPFPEPLAPACGGEGGGEGGLLERVTCLK